MLVNGVDVREQELEELWSSIGLVPQAAYLFSGTVASNLRFGRPEATDAELWRALEIAQARDFVAAMPGGLDAPIDQGGTNVSGGQRQRLSIARALVKQPRLYLFDDCFSALDAATDARLRAALKAGDARRGRGDRGPAGEHDHARRPDHRARRRAASSGWARTRAAGELRSLPGDRRVAARRGGRRMSMMGGPGAGWRAAGWRARRSGAKDPARRCGGCSRRLRPERFRLVLALLLGVTRSASR